MSDGSVALYGWSFLVARGRQTGYRALLVPDFLAESNEYGVLSEAATGDLDTPEASRVSTVTGLTAGTITLAYRTERMTHALLGGSIPSTGHGTDDLMTDQHGRPLDLLFGFVCRAPGLLEVDAADFAPAHEDGLRVYREFLADERGFTPTSSHPYLLRSIASNRAEPASESLQPSPPEEPFRRAAVASPPRSPTRRLIPLVAVGLLATSGVAWYALLGGADEGRVTDVHVESPSTNSIACGSSVTFRGKIKTSGPAHVVYHWESDAGTTAQDRVDFRKAEERSIDNPVTLRGMPGQQIKGTLTLVIEQPNALKDTNSYELTCR